MRDLINATFCVLRSGCPWRMVPDRFAPQTNGGNLRDSFSTRMSEKGRTSPFRGEGGKVRIRRNLAVRARSGEGRLSTLSGPPR
jgi:transposase